MIANHYQEILSILHQVKYIDLSRYRRSVIERRITARMAILNIDDASAYVKSLQENPSECGFLLDYVTINFSSFFRNPLVFEIIAQDILSSLLEKKQTAGNNEIRIWSAGCAAGEEAYSIAILLHQELEKTSSLINPYVFATDIDSQALKTAHKGIYPREHCKNIKLGFLDEYFKPAPDGYAVSPSIKRMVSISHDDLTSAKTSSPADSIFGTFDLILCRNVLIYFTQELQEFVFRKLYQALAPDGYLVLGESEIICQSLESKIRVIDRKNRIYAKR